MHLEVRCIYQIISQVKNQLVRCKLTSSGSLEPLTPWVIVVRTRSHYPPPFLGQVNHQRTFFGFSLPFLQNLRSSKEKRRKSQRETVPDRFSQLCRRLLRGQEQDQEQEHHHQQDPQAFRPASIPAARQARRPSASTASGPGLFSFS